MIHHEHRVEPVRSPAEVIAASFSLPGYSPVERARMADRLLGLLAEEGYCVLACWELDALVEAGRTVSE